MTDLRHDPVRAIGLIEAVPRILDVVCRTTGLGFAAVARVTDEKWIACAVRDGLSFGLQPGGELPLTTTLCHEVCQSGAMIVIDHVAEDPLFRHHATPALYGFQSYVSVPIILGNGAFFGTLCAIDYQPHTVSTAETVGMFTLFAELIGFHLDALERLATTEESLRSERAVSELREQFIAVLGHDLRNPLTAIQASAELLSKTPLPVRLERLPGLIRGSVGRITRLIDDVLDFARGRLGGGVELTLDPQTALQPTLAHVIGELRAGWPDRTIVEDLKIDLPVRCDKSRIGQMLSNLLSNALTHGAPDGPVRVIASTTEGQFALSVANSGPAIPTATMSSLFEPFFRGGMRPRQQGLGLGLYIASQIARSHGGTLSAQSDDSETCFTFVMGLTAVGAG